MPPVVQCMAWASRISQRTHQSRHKASLLSPHCALLQLAFLKQLTSIKLDAVLSPNKALSTAAPKRLRALRLTFKSTRGNAQPQHTLDLSK